MTAYTKPGKAEPLSSRSIVRLLRFIGKGPAVLRGEADGEFAVESLHQSRSFATSVVRQAVASGLLEQTGSQMTPTSAAPAFLKRALVKDRDEIFQEQHRDCETVSTLYEGQWTLARRNELSSPLQALARLKEKQGDAYFSADALTAGERLARDFHRGQLSPRITASWEPLLEKRIKGQKSGVEDLCDSAVAARQRFSEAADAMGPELSGVAIDVCCFEKGLELVERERQWPCRSAKLMLRTALQTLVRHYAPTQSVKSSSSHHWGAEGYRPSL